MLPRFQEPAEGRCYMMSPEVMELIASNGDVRLASERTHLSVHDLMARLISSQELPDAIRMSVSLQLLDLISNYKVALIASMDEMSPRDLARAFNDLVGMMGGVGGGVQEGSNTGHQTINILTNGAPKEVTTPKEFTLALNE